MGSSLSPIFSLGIPLSDTFLNIVTYIIIFTNVITAFGSVLKIRQQKEGFREFMKNVDKMFQSI